MNLNDFSFVWSKTCFPFFFLSLNKNASAGAEYLLKFSDLQYSREALLLSWK